MSMSMSNVTAYIGIDISGGLEPPLALPLVSATACELFEGPLKLRIIL